MTQKIGDMEIGTQFLFEETIYVRIPEMVLKCGTHGFLVNVIYVKEPHPDWNKTPSINIAKFMHPDTIVELVVERETDVSVQDEKE